MEVIYQDQQGQEIHRFTPFFGIPPRHAVGSETFIGGKFRRVVRWIEEDFGRRFIVVLGAAQQS